LRGAHRGPDVVLGEHPLDRDRGWLVLVQPALDLVGHGEQAGGQVGVGRRPHHVDGDTADGPAPAAVDHPQAAPGQTGVDPEHPHAFALLPRTSVRGSTLPGVSSGTMKTCRTRTISLPTWGFSRSRWKVAASRRAGVPRPGPPSITC